MVNPGKKAMRIADLQDQASTHATGKPKKAGCADPSSPSNVMKKVKTAWDRSMKPSKSAMKKEDSPPKRGGVTFTMDPDSLTADAGPSGAKSGGAGFDRVKIEYIQAPEDFVPERHALPAPNIIYIFGSEILDDRRYERRAKLNNLLFASACRSPFLDPHVMFKNLIRKYPFDPTNDNVIEDGDGLDSSFPIGVNTTLLCDELIEEFESMKYLMDETKDYLDPKHRRFMCYEKSGLAKPVQRARPPWEMDGFADEESWTRETGKVYEPRWKLVLQKHKKAGVKLQKLPQVPPKAKVKMERVPRSILKRHVGQKGVVPKAKIQGRSRPVSIATCSTCWTESGECFDDRRWSIASYRTYRNQSVSEYYNRHMSVMSCGASIRHGRSSMATFGTCAWNPEVEDYEEDNDADIDEDYYDEWDEDDEEIGDDEENEDEDELPIANIRNPEDPEYVCALPSKDPANFYQQIDWHNKHTIFTHYRSEPANFCPIELPSESSFPVDLLSRRKLQRAKKIARKAAKGDGVAFDRDQDPRYLHPTMIASLTGAPHVSNGKMIPSWARTYRNRHGNRNRSIKWNFRDIMTHPGKFWRLFLRDFGSRIYDWIWPPRDPDLPRVLMEWEITRKKGVKENSWGWAGFMGFIYVLVTIIVGVGYVILANLGTEEGEEDMMAW